MASRELAALIIASVLVTFDGTAVTVAVPAIGRVLNASLSQLQWISNAPLLALTTLLLPAGALADLYGRRQLVRLGLVIFCLASFICAAAPSAAVLIGGRLLQGTGGALILPCALARLRAVYSDPGERARQFGVWAAWTGFAGALGPLLGGALADTVSWRAVFVTSSSVAALGFILLRHTPRAAQQRGSQVPLFETTALGLGLAAFAYLLYRRKRPALDVAPSRVGWCFDSAGIDGIHSLP